MDEKNKLRNNFSENEIEKTPRQGEESDCPVLKLTPEMKERLKKRIQQYEEERERTEKIYAQLSEEDLEALRLGKELQERRRKAAERGDTETLREVAEQETTENIQKSAETEATEEKTSKKFSRKHNQARKKKQSGKKTEVANWKKNALAMAAGMGIVLVTASSFAIVSVGGPKQALEVAREMFGERSRIAVNSTIEGEDKKSGMDGMDEEEKAYQQIKDELGFDPVRLGYLPEGMVFSKSVLDVKSQDAYFCYKTAEDKSVSYIVKKQYAIGNLSADIEDKLIDEFFVQIDNNEVTVLEYWVEDIEEEKYVAEFVYDNTWYCIFARVEREEMEKIIKNLIFF